MAERRHLGWLPVAVKVGLSVAMIALVLGVADVEAVWVHMTRIEISTVCMAVGLCFAQILLAGARWTIIGVGTGDFVAPWVALRATFAAMFCNQLLPTSIGGDVVRVGLLTGQGLTIGRAARTVVLDRTAGLLSLLTLMGVTGFVLSDQLPESWPVELIRLLPVIAVGLVLVGLFVGDRIVEALETREMLPWFAQLFRDSSALLRQGVRTVVILALSYAIHAASAASIWILARDSGVAIGYAQVLGFLPIVILMLMLPISIAGWGVREGTVVTLFALLGIGSAPAAAVSILWGACIALAALVAGVIWAVSRPKGERLPSGDPPQTP
jgi:uncharacterized protein (TIRG00374 family)